MRLKVQCLTRVEKQYIGSLGNGTRASTAAAPPHPLASGEQVSIWVRQAEQREGVARRTPAGERQRPFSISSLSLNYARATDWRRQWQPTPVLLPAKSHGWRSLVGCSPWDR